MAFRKPIITHASFNTGKILVRWSYRGDVPTGFVVTVSIPGEYADNTRFDGMVEEGTVAAPVTRPGGTFVIVTPAIDQGAVDDAASDPHRVENL